MNTSDIPMGFLNLSQNEVIYVDETKHAISFPEITIAVLIFITLAYWYVKVTKEPEKYKQWTNPNGKIIDLHKIVRRMFWVYSVMIMIVGIIQILLQR